MTTETFGFGSRADAFAPTISEARVHHARAHEAICEPVVVPRLKLTTESLVVDDGDAWSSRLDEREAPVIELSFDYGGSHVRASDPRERFFRSTPTGVFSVERDTAFESRARYVLEGFGALELACVPEFGVPPDSRADYLLSAEADVHVFCAFSAYAIPQLRAMGWQIEVDAAYPYRVVATDSPWYADVSAEPGRPDWFGLELGVDVEGRRVNMLPVLIDLLEKSPDETSLKRLTRSEHRLFALPVGDGRYLTVPSERVRDVMRVLVELYQGAQRPTARLVAPLCHAGALERLDHAFSQAQPSLRWHDDARVRDRGRSIATLGVEASGVVEPVASEFKAPALCAELRPYQAAGVRWLQSLRKEGVGGVLADDMGLGKTLQVIAYLVAEKAAGRLVPPALVVCPTSLIGNWGSEFARFAPGLRVACVHGSERHRVWSQIPATDVVLTSYPLLVRDEARWLEFAFSNLILDEAHVIKNVRSQVHRAASAIRADHRLCLTGTPVENHLGELQALFDFMMPEFFGGVQRFREMYRVPIESRGDEERLEALRMQVAPYILRRLKSGVAPELPPKTILVRPVELRGKQRDLYESIRMAAHADVRRTIRKKGFGASTIAILDALMKLRQLCCDPRLLTMEAARFVRESAKFELLMELVPQQVAQGRRLLIFSQYTRMLALISHGLQARGIGHVELTGATQDRQRPIMAFERGEVDVFLISLKAGGVGLNLTSADTVIHYDPWWNPAAQAQATDRAYRIGQTKPVFVYNLMTTGSVEERMMQLQRRKQHLAHSVLGEASGFLLDEHEVDALLAPLDDSETRDI